MSKKYEFGGAFMIELASYRDKKQIIKSYPYTKPYLKRKGTLYVDKINDECRGFAFVQKRKIVNEPNKTEDLILVIEVFKEENRNKGIASALVQHIISEARRNGSYQIIAYYQKNNIPSHKLWIKNSFSIIGVKNSVTQMVSCIATYKI